MRSVGIKLLKNQLSKYIRLAEQGEIVLICDRDRVVAILSPPGSTLGHHVSDVMLADAIRKGFVRPALMPPETPPHVEPAMTFDELMGELEQDRSDR